MPLTRRVRFSSVRVVRSDCPGRGQDGRIVAEHPRAFGRGATLYAVTHAERAQERSHVNFRGRLSDFQGTGDLKTYADDDEPWCLLDVSNRNLFRARR